jgi:hypothetical protein
VPGRDDWGVPDWLDPHSYPRHSGPSAGVAWSWEFLRRSPAYREFWMKDVLPFVGADGSIEVVDASVPGVLKKAEDCFGLLLGPRDPRSPVAPAPTDGNAIRQIVASRFYPELPVELSRWDVGYVFDLRRPPEPQFDRALQAFRDLQADRRKTGELAVESARRREDRYACYLRLIDAEDAGAAPREIADELFGDIAREYPGDPRSSAFQNARRAAHRLRDEGYRALAST